VSFLDAIILGALQGLTEFLPVSSSGHLVLSEHLLGIKQPGVAFEVLLHLGTLLSVLIYFRRPVLDLVRSLFTPSMIGERRMLLYLFIGTIPAGLVGFLFDDVIEAAFSSPLVTSFFLILTGVILLLTSLPRTSGRELSPTRAIVIGVGQALAIFPGISRSGTTIAFGLFAGIKPAKAAEFSFLLAVPAIAGAAVLKSGELLSLNAGRLWQYLSGGAVSFVTGLVAVYLVLEAIRRGRFVYFAYYCFAVGLIGLYLFW